MDKKRFYPRMALVNLARNGQFYVPYLLTVMTSPPFRADFSF